MTISKWKVFVTLKKEIPTSDSYIQNEAGYSKDSYFSLCTVLAFLIKFYTKKEQNSLYWGHFLKVVYHQQG